MERGAKREAVSSDAVAKGRNHRGMRFSKFFKATVRFSRDEFCRRFGLDPSKPIITYLGSSRTIAPEEHLFLWRWIEALRSCDVPQVMACNVFVRPHPMNNAIWDQWPKECPRNIGVWDGSDNDVRGVIDCVSHSVAVVGVNTTAMLEAAALGKPVLTVLDDAVRAGQAERIHFDHLTSVAGGLVTAARDFDEHVSQVSALLKGDDSFVKKSERFSQAFLLPPRPYDLPVLAFRDAVEQLAGVGRFKSSMVRRFFIDRFLRS